MVKLYDIFMKNETSIHKWENYFDIYEHYLSKFRNKSPKFLEIGVQYGGSLFMWKEFFQNAEIHGIDINPDCKKLEFDNLKIHIGSQNDIEFLSNFGNKVGSLDVIIDDGGHTMKQQINTFEILFPILNEGGIYICEDTESSYQNMYGGGPKRRGTFIEYSKNLIDVINANHSHFNSLKPTELSKKIEFIHFYNNVTIFRKKTIKKFPVNIRNNGKEPINVDKRKKVNALKLFLSSIISFINYALGLMRLKPLYIGSTSQKIK